VGYLNVVLKQTGYFENFFSGPSIRTADESAGLRRASATANWTAPFYRKNNTEMGVI
jgi:hypothetical protein